MAGSYNHCVVTDKDSPDYGKLLRNRELVGMVENLGDAYEAIEEMYGMIWLLANDLAHEVGFEDEMQRTRELVEHARINYQIGLTVSPGTNGRNPEEEDD